MLQECIKFGEIRRIVTPEGPYYDGSVALVFTYPKDAQKCAETMHGRFFDGRVIEVEMQGNLDPHHVPQRILPPGGLLGANYGDGEDDEEDEGQARGGLGSGGGGDNGKKGEADDLDAFFGSLEQS